MKIPCTKFEIERNGIIKGTAEARGENNRIDGEYVCGWV